MAAGYSKRSLAEKLGIKQESVVLVINSPVDYGELVVNLPRNIAVISNPAQRGEKSPSMGDLSSLSFIEMTNKYFDIIHCFVRTQLELQELFPQLKSQLNRNGMLWISWLKSSRITPDKLSKQTNLNENLIREVGLENGLVDVKVIAINEEWSGLKFVYRLKDR